MNPADIESYLRQLDRELRRRFVGDMTILEEVRGHLTDAVEREQQRGRTVAEAQSIAIERFGSTATVADAYAADRSRWLYRTLFVVAIALGVAIAWVDSRPNWDDSGITAGTLMVVAGMLGLAGIHGAGRVWALLVGILDSWCTRSRTRHQWAKLAMLAVLLFPMAGALTPGWRCVAGFCRSRGDDLRPVLPQGRGAVVSLLVALVIAAVQAVRGKLDGAGRTCRQIGNVAATYFAIIVVVSLASPRQVIPDGRGAMLR